MPPTCSNCNPCTMQQEPIRQRVLVTPLAEGNGWLWHVIPGRSGRRNWGEAPTREEAQLAGQDYIDNRRDR